MSLKKIEQVKTDKGFRIWDLIIYGIVILLVIVLFIAVFTTKDRSPLNGIRIMVVNQTVYEYDFKEGEVSRNNDFVEITEDSDDKLVIKVNTGGNGYNLVEIDKSGSVKVIEANCSNRRDCVYSAAIKDNSGIISCPPHGLKILPYNFDIDDGKIII